MEKFKVSIGDWSKDGHSKCDEFVFESNYTVEELREAYKQSCKLTGLQFNDGKNYTGLTEHDSYRSNRHICNEYEDSSLSNMVKKNIRRT